MATQPTNPVSDKAQAPVQVLDFAGALAAYIAARDDQNTHPAETAAREAQYQAALAGAWKLRPVTRADGVAFARFMLEELDGRIPEDQDNFADAVEATLRALLTKTDGAAEQVDRARSAIETTQNQLRLFAALFRTMADAMGPEAGRVVTLSGDDYHATLSMFGHHAEALTDAFEGPVGALIEVERALDGGE